MNRELEEAQIDAQTQSHVLVPRAELEACTRCLSGVAANTPGELHIEWSAVGATCVYHSIIWDMPRGVSLAGYTPYIRRDRHEQVLARLEQVTQERDEMRTALSGNEKGQMYRRAKAAETERDDERERHGVGGVDAAAQKPEAGTGTGTYWVVRRGSGASAIYLRRTASLYGGGWWSEDLRDANRFASRKLARAARVSLLDERIVRVRPKAKAATEGTG